MKKVIVKGPILTQSGYGEHTRFIFRSLMSRPDLFDVYLIPTSWGKTGWLMEETEERNQIDEIVKRTAESMQKGIVFDVSMQVTIPNEFERIARYNIGVTAGTETTKISPEWLTKCIDMEKIIVVSEHTRDSILNTKYLATNNKTQETLTAKVTCPVDVINYPVKSYKKTKLNLDLKYDTNFLTVGTWIPRKNMDNTIKWFLETFKDDEVGLIVKTSQAKNCLADRRNCLNKLNGILKDYEDRKCEVYLLHGDMSEQEMHSLYQDKKVSALISFTHGEGYGLPLFEAAYSGLPIIATNWSGHLDFLKMPSKGKMKPMFYPVSHELKFIQKEAVWPGVLIAESEWAFPKEWDAKRKMRQFLKNKTAAKTQATKLKKYLKENFSQEIMMNKVVESVEYFYDNKEKVSDEVVVL
jgi:glycosyltransferase involved in cell wall biosynthesis